MTERESKRARLDALLDAHDLDELVLRDPPTWRGTSAARASTWCRSRTPPILEVTVSRTGDELRTSVIEAPRLLAEELAGDAPPLRALPWWQPLDAGDDQSARARGSDVPRAGERDVRGDLVAARSVLTDPELERYRALCRDSAAATGAALRGARGEESELALAGRAARELYERGIEPLVMLVAGEDRLPLHRHPLPTAARLGTRAMLVVCGRRQGLVSAVTRMRAFTPLAPAERATYADCSASRPRSSTPRAPARASATSSPRAPRRTRSTASRRTSGTPITRRTDRLRDARHLAGPATDVVARDRQAFAWNPSGGGFKLEDPVLATDGGVEVLSPDPEWPAIAAGRAQRPDVLAWIRAASSAGCSSDGRCAASGSACVRAPRMRAPIARQVSIPNGTSRSPQITVVGTAISSSRDQASTSPSPASSGTSLRRMRSFIVERQLARGPADASLRRRRSVEPEPRVQPGELAKVARRFRRLEPVRRSASCPDRAPPARAGR